MDLEGEWCIYALKSRRLTCNTARRPQVIKLTDTVSQFLVYFNDGRLAYIEHQLEHVTALEEKVSSVPVLEQANAMLEADNATLGYVTHDVSLSGLMNVVSFTHMLAVS